MKLCCGVQILSQHRRTGVVLRLTHKCCRNLKLIHHHVLHSHPSCLSLPLYALPGLLLNARAPSYVPYSIPILRAVPATQTPTTIMAPLSLVKPAGDWPHPLTSRGRKTMPLKWPPVPSGLVLAAPKRWEWISRTWVRSESVS